MTQLAEDATKLALKLRKNINSPFYMEDTVNEIVSISNKHKRREIKAKDDYINYLKTQLYDLKVKYEKELDFL